MSKSRFWAGKEAVGTGSFVAGQIRVCSHRLRFSAAHHEECGSMSLPITLQNSAESEMCWENLKRAWLWIPPKCFGVLCALTEVRRENRSMEVLLFFPVPLILCSYHLHGCSLNSLFTPRPSTADAHFFAFSAMDAHCWKQSSCCKVNMGFEALTVFLKS